MREQHPPIPSESILSGGGGGALTPPIRLLLLKANTSHNLVTHGVGGETGDRDGGSDIQDPNWLLFFGMTVFSVARIAGLGIILECS